MHRAQKLPARRREGILALSDRAYGEDLRSSLIERYAMSARVPSRTRHEMFEGWVSRHQIAACLLLIAGSGPDECRLVTGPDGLCAFLRLEPARSELHIGDTLRVRVNGATCSGGDCIDCGTRQRMRWRSAAPEVASVNSSGVIRAERPGSARILAESEAGSRASTADMQLVVVP